MRAALGRLTRAERELVALRVVLGLDAAEAGRIAGMSPSAVGTSLHRALTKLRQEVERP
jgi:RNA polymerase sigma-70 factor (ECF subfamily)